MKGMMAPVGALALALLLGVGGLMAHARQPDDKAEAATSGKLGSIDMEEIYNASGAPQELDQAGRQHEGDAAQRINKIMAVPYLEPAELEEYGTLIGKVKMTPEEEKRVEALKAINDGRSAELAQMLAKPGGTITPEEFEADRPSERYEARPGDAGAPGSCGRFPGAARGLDAGLPAPPDRSAQAGGCQSGEREGNN